MSKQQLGVKKMSFPFLIQGKNITIVIDNVPHTISESHVAYQKIKDAIRADDETAVRDLVNPKKVVLDFGQGNVSIKGDTLYWQGNEMHNALADRMISMLTEGFSVEPLVFFMENLQKNPSKRAVDELYGFLEHNTLPITPDGFFLAYKKVNKNFRDIHSNTFDNSVGQTVRMARNAVDDNKDVTCSQGLHFCSIEYLDHFGSSDDPIMILKISPEHVVSIPTDYNNSKGRCCEYTVVGQLATTADTAFTSTVQSNANGVPVDDTPEDEGGDWSYPMSVREAAYKLGITESAVRKRAYRGHSVMWENDEEVVIWVD
jgi:hypothetical protein